MTISEPYSVQALVLKKLFDLWKLILGYKIVTDLFAVVGDVG